MRNNEGERKGTKKKKCIMICRPCETFHIKVKQLNKKRTRTSTTKKKKEWKAFQDGWMEEDAENEEYYKDDNENQDER